MAKGFFLKLALTNLNRNKRVNIPYFVASTIMTAVYFMVLMILHSRSIGNLHYGMTIQQMFGMGNVVMIALILIFMLYINSFLIKGRKKEFGLYGILGLEKRHVGRVILWENLLLSAGSLALGIIIGTVFGRLVFMLLLHAFRVVASGTAFVLPWQAYVYTSALFAVAFILTTVYNLFHVSMANPIDLLKGGQKGEKKVRFVLPLTFIGAAMLAVAYYIALSVDNPLAALNQFFIAVILVIAATYLLFTTGSVFLLDFLKKRKRFYYRANNMVAISGMFHRMKQNAAGLASICILSTMVLVTVASSGSLFIGQESILADMFPNDVTVTMDRAVTEEELTQLDRLLADLETEHSVSLEGRFSYTFGDTVQMLKDGEFSIPDYFQYQEIMNYLMDLTVIPLADYNRYSQDNLILSDNEVLVLSSETRIPDLFEIGGTRYRVKARIADSVFSRGKSSYGASFRTTFIVAADEEATVQMLENFGAESDLARVTTFNIKGTNDNGLDFARDLRVCLESLPNVQRVSDIFTERIEGYGIFGGLLFLGAFFIILFLMATILIIYFKQISEGYDDKARFEILQKVGMDDREVKAAINRQILIVFFLPLGAAFLHILAASPMIVKLLQVFNLYNTPLTALCIALTCLFFALVYVAVFRVTAKTYYGIVKW